MQKQKIDCIYYLVLQNTYENIEVALYEKDKFLQKEQLNKIDACKNLILLLDSICKNNNVGINDLSFLGINKGPGPFTTLRVVITTANAINFATKIPLIGIDGLQALLNEKQDKNYSVNIAMLNAYNNDVYFAIKTEFNVDEGCMNIQKLLTKIKDEFSDNKIRFIGNGSILFENEIKKLFGGNVFISKTNLKTSSIEQIAKESYKNWKENKNLINQIIPLYLKGPINK